jgi:hypothetical protein
VQRHINRDITEGNCEFNISFKTDTYQLQKNIWYGNIGYYAAKNEVDFFILDEENFEKYTNGKRFICHNYLNSNKEEFNFFASNKNWYLVFRNHARRTNIILDFSIEVKSSKNNYVEIVQPDTNIFENPIFNVGERVNISGIANNNVTLTIEYPSKLKQLKKISIDNGWIYNWNTSGLNPGEYKIKAECDNVSDTILIKLQDMFIPEILIENPKENLIFEENIINISGKCFDNFGINKVEVSIDNDEYENVFGLEEWFINYDISSLDLKKHTIFIRATDFTGLESIYSQHFFKNESGHVWGPKINNIYHLPENPINTSNIVIFTNMSSTSPYDISRVILYYENSTEITSHKMFRYGDNPVQERHEEDPLFNKSNKPIYGCELGQFQNGESINYWIVAFDDVNNSKISSKKSFTIGY